MLTIKLLRRSAVVAIFALALMACGSDDSSTEAGTSGDGDAEATTTTVADADESDDDHSDEADDHGDDDHDDDHSDEDDDHGNDDHDDDGDHDDHDDHDDEDGSSGGLGAHEHGVAELSLAWSDAEVVIDLISPTYNIFGFEQEASTDEERALVADRTEALTQPGVIALNEEAGCELVGDASTELEYEGSHAEITASWLFDCENLDEIQQLDLTALFAEFPNLEDVDAQWASPSGQSAGELSPSSTVLSLG